MIGPAAYAGDIHTEEEEEEDDDEDEEGLRAALQASFREVTVKVIRGVAMFSMRRPKKCMGERSKALIGPKFAGKE